jgi:RNA polymerase sigma-70 factor, ECF subfamily
MIDAMNVSFMIREEMMAGSQELEGALPVMGEEEFRLFYERTARPLWSYLSRISGDRQKADDFLQEAFYRIYRAGARYESESHRRNALFQIATNLVRDAARRSRRYEEVALPDEQQSIGRFPVSSAPAPERQAEIRTDLERAMNQLEPVQRELLWLAYAQGSSHEEIASILGLRTISVRTLLFRARKKAAGLLGGAARTSQGAE